MRTVSIKLDHGLVGGPFSWLYYVKWEAPSTMGGTILQEGNSELHKSEEGSMRWNSHLTLLWGLRTCG